MLPKFRRVLVDKDNKCEACSVFDTLNNGGKDIVCGEYVYTAPYNAENKRKICTLIYDGNYVHDFSDFPMDCNGDGYMDIVTGSWWGEGLFWRENPKNDTDEWKTHLIEPMTNIETIRYFDIDGDGELEIFPNAPSEPPCFFKLIKDLNGSITFKKYVLGTENAGHGMGFGDVNGDGKVDIILSNGWIEQPDDVYSSDWKRHYDFNIPGACVPILCYDVNGDGINDIIIGNGHGYGLWWLEQQANGNFLQHVIDDKCSQYHDMQLFDIDGDGELELITGARYFAHNGNDPGEHDPIGTYIFKINKGNFEKHVLDYGSPETTSGLGIYFWMCDLNGNGKVDIIAPGKEGLYIFYNEG